MEKKKREKKTTNEKPISLYPLKPDEVLKKIGSNPIKKRGKKEIIKKT